MTKKLLSLLLALSMIVACMTALPVLASEPDYSTMTVTNQLTASGDALVSNGASHTADGFNGWIQGITSWDAGFADYIAADYVRVTFTVEGEADPSAQVLALQTYDVNWGGWGGLYIPISACAYDEATGVYTYCAPMSDLLATLNTGSDLLGIQIIFMSAEPVVTLLSYETLTAPAAGETTAPEVTEPEVTEPEVTEPEVTEPEATGYTAKLGYAAAGDWYPSEWGDNVYTTVTGAGTYSLSWNPGDAADGAEVFVVDIVGAWAEYGQTLSLTALTLTADGVEIPMDLANITVGDLENNGNFRIQLANMGASNPGLASLAFSENLTVTFTLGQTAAPEEPTEPETTEPETTEPETTEPSVSETTEATDSTGETTEDGRLDYSFTAKLGYADADWWPSEWDLSRTVNGAGSYSMTWKMDKDAGEAIDGAMVFVIDIVDAARQLAADGYAYKLTGLSVKVDGVSVPVSLSKVSTGDLEGNGNFRIEIYNEYGSTKDAIDVSKLVASEKLSVRFTLAIVDAQTGEIVDDSNPATGDSFRPAAVFGVMVCTIAAMAFVTRRTKEND